MSPSIWSVVTTSSAMTAVPSSASVPTIGRVTIVTLASVAPASSSSKPKSSAVKAYALSSPVVTVLSAAVGAVLVEAVPTVICKPPDRGTPFLSTTPESDGRARGCPGRDIQRKHMRRGVFQSSPRETHAAYGEFLIGVY